MIDGATVRGLISQGPTPGRSVLSGNTPSVTHHSGIVARHFDDPVTPSIRQMKRRSDVPSAQIQGMIVRVFHVRFSGVLRIRV